MVEEDFDVAGLASYLHMQPAQVIKLVDRGKLPARRVGGGWRFSRAEIHHWLENRIGLSDDTELAELETSLERADQQSMGDISIAALMPVEAISIPLAARTRSSVITAMCDLAANTGLLWDASKMADAVTAREAMHPTALDIGVALLHPRRPQSSILAEAVLALGITSRGIPFGGSSSLTDMFFLICSTTDHEHLRILARLSRMITSSDWLDALRDADDARAAHRLISERDSELRA